jgi:hypothetical protein
VSQFKAPWTVYCCRPRGVEEAVERGVSQGARTIYKEGKFGPFGRRSKCIPCDSILASDHSSNRPAALSVYWVTAVYLFSGRRQTELTASSRPPKPTVLIPTTDLANQYTVRNWHTGQTVGGSGRGFDAHPPPTTPRTTYHPRRAHFHRRDTYIKYPRGTILTSPGGPMTVP